MTEGGIMRMLEGLFAAAGRNVGITEAEVYGEALSAVTDKIGEEAGRRLWTHVSWEHPPSPRMVLEQVQAVIRGKRGDEPQRALPSGPEPMLVEDEHGYWWLGEIPRGRQQRRPEKVEGSDELADDETTAWWTAHIREQLANVSGPLVGGLRRTSPPLVMTPNEPDFRDVDF